MSGTAFPARMSFEDCLRSSEESRARHEAAAALERSLATRPQTGNLRRYVAFAAAADNRLLQDWFAPKLAPDELLRWNLPKLVRRARDMEVNNSTIRNYLRMVPVNVIGADGVRLQAQLKAADGKTLLKRENDLIEEAWDEWGECVDMQGRLDFVSFQRLAIKNIARDGEVLVRVWRGAKVNRFRFALEMLDPELLDADYFVAKGENRGEIRAGVEVDDDGRAVAYWIWNRYESSYSSRPRKRERVPADQIFHLYDPDRVGQTRGVPWLVSVMVPARHLEAYREASLVAARVAAAKMFFFKKTDASMPSVQPEDGDGSGSVTGEDPKGSFLFEANPGSGWVLPPGYDLAPWNPNSPSTEFGSFCKDSLRQVATGLPGAGYNSLSSDLESVNYSSLRFGSALERDVWRVIQRWWIAAFLRPLYREWMKWVTMDGENNEPALQLGNRPLSRLTRARWQPRGWQSVDPYKEVQAGVIGLRAGLTSRRKLLAEQGLDLEDVFDDLAEEKAMADERGIDISGDPAPAEPAPKPDDGEDKNDDEEKDTGKAKGGRDREPEYAGHVNGNGDGPPARRRRF